MIKIKNLMDYLYTKLSMFAPVHFENMERNNEGNIIIEGTNIVYKIEGAQLTQVESIVDFQLTIDFWYLLEDFYDIENMVLEVDDTIFGKVIKNEDSGTFRIFKSDNFLMNIRDEDGKIRRKRLNYIVRYYGL